MKNRIRELREKKKLSQRQLASLAKTSQQQLQRIESGKQTARLDLANNICQVLGFSMRDVFPEAKAALAKAKAKLSGDEAQSFLNNPDLQDELAASGIESDPREWTFKYLFRNGAQGALPIAGKEYRRLFSAVQDSSPFNPFVLFDTPTARVALNRKYLVFSQFLYDFPQPEITNEDSVVHRIAVLTSALPEPLYFEADPDTEDLDADAEAEGVQLQDIFYFLETWSEDDQLITFEDIDGERAFFRNADVAMVSVPLALLPPRQVEEEDA